MQKMIGVALVAMGAALAPAAHAQWSGNLGIVSLYKSRGVDQDMRDKAFRPALQGGVRYDWASGFYVNNWNSTGRFGDAHVEIDLGAGFTRELSNGLSYDIGYVHYLYPNESTWNSGDLYAGLSYQNLSLYVYRGTRKDVNKNDMYYQLSYTHPLTERLSLTAGLGFLDYGASGLRSKTDASLGFAYALQEKLTLSVQVQRANHRQDAFNAERDTRLVVGLTTSF